MPPKLTEIFEADTLTGGGSLQIDEDRRLYWNGKRVLTEQKIELQWWVNISLVVGGISTAVIALFAALTYFR